VSVSAALQRALDLKRAGSMDDALIALEGVLAQAPNHPAALANLAEVQLRRNRPQEAAAALDGAEAAAGRTAFTARLRGDLEARARRWADAARAYEHAEALGDRGTWSLVQLARCRLHLGDLEGARGAASRAIEKDEGASAAWTLLGEMALREDKLDEAEAMLERAHQHAPADEFAYAKLVEIRLLRLPPERRDREIDVLLKSSGRGNRHLLGSLARLRSRRGDDKSAAEAWGLRVQQHGNDHYARKMQGYSLRKAGLLDEAAPVLRACLIADPEDLILFRTYIHLQRRRGAIDELREALEELLPSAGNRSGAVHGELRKLRDT